MSNSSKFTQYLIEAEEDFERGREREEDEPEGEESHRHRLIPFPANSTALDTEDYDWYKFGVAASDLDDADPSQFGQGDSDIVVVPFGNKDAERLMPLLKRTGIAVKRLGPEDRPEVTKESLADGYGQVMEYLKKVKGRWALVSKSTGRPLQYYRGPKGQRPSDEWVKGVERRVHSFEATGSVTEVNYPDELSVDEDLISRFTDKGWQIAGEGRDQIVLSKSGGRQVLKIVGQDSDIRLQTIKRYVEFFRNNQRNPHFPRVGFDKLLRWKDKIYYAYAQEALTHLSGDEAVLDYLENLGRSIAHNGDIPKNIPPGLTEEQVDGLAMSIEHLIERFGTESLDLGNVYNYMQRANGQIVIIDPLGAFGDEELHEGCVSEAFDQPYKLKWEKGDYGDVDAYAKLPDGNYLSIMFNKGVLQDSKEEAWSVEFFRNNSQEVTGEGDAQRVFATVLSAIQTFIKKYKPNKVIFSASKEVEPGQNAQSRSNLYDRLVQRYANALGFKAFRADAGSKVHYELSRLKPVKEQFSEMELAIMEGGGDLEEYYDSLSEDAAGVGVVANKKQARDPRYMMSITKDVQPGEPARQAAKFGNKLDKNGLPPLLHKTAVRESISFAQMTAQQISAVAQDAFAQLYPGVKLYSRETVEGVGLSTQKGGAGTASAFAGGGAERNEFYITLNAYAEGNDMIVVIEDATSGRYKGAATAIIQALFSAGERLYKTQSKELVIKDNSNAEVWDKIGAKIGARVVSEAGINIDQWVEYQLKEDASAGSTSAGSVAVVSAPLGSIFARDPMLGRSKKRLKKQIRSIYEFKMPNYGGDGGDGDDGFSEETLKQLAAQWYNGDEDPKIEKTLALAGWEIGQDEGYDIEPGVFVVQAGDVNGNSYLSWPAHELRQDVSEAKESIKDQIEKAVMVDGGNINEYFVRSATIDKLGYSAKQTFGRSPDIGDDNFSVDYIGANKGKPALWFYPLSYYLKTASVKAYGIDMPHVWLVRIRPNAWLQPVTGDKVVKQPAPDGKERVGLLRKSAVPAAIFFKAAFDVIDKFYDHGSQHKRHGKVKGVAEGLNEYAPAGGGGNIPRGPKTPRRGPWDDGGEDPYQLRRYNRSIDFFDQFDSDGVDKQNFDKATGEYEGYYFDRDADSGITQIAYFKFDDPTKIGDNDPGIGWYYEPIDEGVAEGATVTRIDSKPITDFASGLKAYKHTDDWSQSGVDTGDDSYWTKKKLKVNTTKGLFAGDPHRTALYATGNAHETRYVEYTENGQPIVYFDKKDLPAIRSRKTYLTVFDAGNFKKLPTGEWFSENPGKPIKQTPIGDPFKYIADQGWIVRVTDDLDKVFKQVQKMHKAGKIDHYGAEGMNESKQGVAEEALNELKPSPGFGGGDDDDKYIPPDFGKPFKANYLGQNKFEVFCRPPGNSDPSKVIKLNAEVQKYGLEWDDEHVRNDGTSHWFLDSPGAVYLSWKYGEIPLPKALDQARNPGHIHDLVTDYLTYAHGFEIQKVAEYFGFTPDGEMGEGVNEGWREKIAAGALGAAAVLGGQQIDKHFNTDTATKPNIQQLAQKPATPREILEKTAKAAGLVGQEFVQFMAQCSHESLNFTRMTEIGTPQYFAKKYDKKFAPKTAKILGNKLPGDGELFKGRGFIQLTGRDNYMRAGKALGLDLINNPDQASEPNTAAKIAVWYWSNRVAPKVDSFHDTKAVTKKINPAAKHLKQRQNQVQKMQMTYDEPYKPGRSPV